MDASTERDPSYGWLMVAVVFLLSSLSFGALGAISIFLKPLSAEFGWGRGTTSLGYTTIAFASALFGVLWGFVADKYGTRWFGVVAAVVMSACLFMLSQQSSLTEFFILYFLSCVIFSHINSLLLFILFFLIIFLSCSIPAFMVHVHYSL